MSSQVILIPRDIRSAPETGFHRPRSVFQPWPSKNSKSPAKRAPETSAAVRPMHKSPDTKPKERIGQQTASPHLRQNSPQAHTQEVLHKSGIVKYKVPSVKELSITKSSVQKTKTDFSLTESAGRQGAAQLYLSNVMTRDPKTVSSVLKAISRGTKLSESNSHDLKSVAAVPITRVFAYPQRDTELLGTGKILTNASLVSVKPEVTKSIKRKTVNALSESLNRSQGNLGAKKVSGGDDYAVDHFVHILSQNAGEKKQQLGLGSSNKLFRSGTTQASESKPPSQVVAERRTLESSSLKALCAKPALQSMPGVTEMCSLGLLAKHPLQFKGVKLGPHLKGDRGHEISCGAKHGYCRQPNGGFFNK